MENAKRFINNLNNIIKQKGFRVKDVVEASGLTRDAVARIQRGQNGLNQENMPKLANSLNCYPSELLPLSWQKPESGELNESVLRDVMKGVMKIYIERHEAAGLDLNWYYDMVIVAYKKYSKDATEQKPVNDNIVYSWLDGKMESR